MTIRLVTIFHCIFFKDQIGHKEAFRKLMPDFERNKVKYNPIDVFSL